MSSWLLALQLFKGRLFSAFKRRTFSLSWEKVASFYLFYPFKYFAKGFTNHECAVCSLLMSHSHHVEVIIQVVIMTGKLFFFPESSNLSDLSLNNTEMLEKTVNYTNLRVLYWPCAVSQRDSSDFLKWGRMRYLSIVCVLPTEDGGRCAPSLEKQPRETAQTLSNILLWTGSAAKTYFIHLKKRPPKEFENQFKCTLY